jgi:kynurenine formamidase
MENHWGTHVDCPAHFFSGGKAVSDYDAEFWFFEHPQVVNLDLQPGQLVSITNLTEHINFETDLLLLKTGWGAFRERSVYSLNGPGISPELGLYLRREYPGLRALGFDFISISSYANRAVGREAHRAFLDPAGENAPLPLIEDMNLSSDLSNLLAVWVAPLIVKEIDSAPCTVFAIFK